MNSISEEAIQSLVRALIIGIATRDDLHDACIKKGWSEEEFFLAYIAAENLYNAIKPIL